MKLLLTLLQATVQKAHAGYEIYCDALGTYCGDGTTYIIHIADRVVTTLIQPLVGGIAVIGVLWASIKMTASFGTDQGKDEAKKIIGYSVTGIFLCITGYAIVHWACLLVQASTGGSGYCS